MEEIGLGEYVRTKNGKIIKCTGFGTFRKDGQNNRVKTIISGRSHYIYDYIVKHSFNIIDLIEVGDYVNGYKVYDISTEYLVDINKEGKILKIEKEGFINATITEGEDDIKSICTREQFENAEYKLDN